VSVFACCGSVGGEDSCAIAIRVIVNKADGVIQGFSLQYNQDRPKDLLSIALHLGLGDKKELHNFRIWSENKISILLGSTTRIFVTCMNTLTVTLQMMVGPTKLPFS
jgi:hypothetical protein